MHGSVDRSGMPGRVAPRHNALGVCMYGVSSRPALAGGVCMYVLNRPERRGRPADSAMMADAAGRPPPGLGPRRSGFRHVGGRSFFLAVFAGGLFLLSSRPGPVGV